MEGEQLQISISDLSLSGEIGLDLKSLMSGEEKRELFT